MSDNGDTRLKAPESKWTLSYYCFAKEEDVEEKVKINNKESQYNVVYKSKVAENGTSL